MTESTKRDRPPRLVTHECEELNVWSARVGFQTDYHQVGEGRFDAWFEMSLSDEFRVVDQFCNLETTISGDSPPGYIPILITHNDGPKGTFHGRELNDCQVAILRPGHETTYRTPPGLRMLSILVPETRLERAFETLTGRELDTVLRGTRLVSLPAPVIDRLRRLSRQVLEAPRDADAGPWLREIDEHFLTALTTGLTPDGDRGPVDGARENHVRYVTAARDYIQAHLGKPLGLETLSREVGVSVRTLEYAFRNVFDETPLQFIKHCRLTAARRHLLRKAEHPGLTVTGVALRCGLGHLGYFARDYRRLFGESPSETLSGASR